MKKHALIVDDDLMIQQMVSFLTTQGLKLRSTHASNGAEMNNVLKHDKVDLLILDLNLPDEDGLVLARQVRSRSNVPILVLTGDESKETLIAALELGVDDFVRKPFDPYELQLRIRNLLGRSQQSHTPKKESLSHILNIGPYHMDMDKRLLIDENGKDIPLTYNEFNLLGALIKAKGNPVSRASLLDTIANGHEAPSERAIDVYIRQLRKKIEPKPDNPEFILSVRGFGYKIA